MITVDHLPETDMHHTRPATQVEIDQCDHAVQQKIAQGWMLRVEVGDDADPQMWLVKDRND